jgi:hypothetical protein
MTTRYLRSKALMAKIETTYAVDAVPTGAANAILCKTDVNFTPMESDRVPREVIQAYMGHQQDLPVATRVKLEFDIEAAGAGGAVDLPPAYGPLLRGCGLAQTINAAVSVSYQPISTGFESLTIYFNQDGVLHKALGCRGSMSVKMTPRGIPYMHFTFLGLYGGVTDTALTAQTLTGFKVPKPVNKANTPTFTLQGYAGLLYDFSMDMKNDLVYRNLVGREDVIITDRHPDGMAEIEATLIAEKDWFTIAQNVTLGATQMIHGVGAGNIFQIDHAAAEIGDPVPTNRDGVVGFQLPLRITPTSAGNDELKVTTK